MSQQNIPRDNLHQSDSEIEYENEIGAHEEDEEDWQDAEEQPSETALQSTPAVATTSQRAHTEDKNKKNIIDEDELRRKIKEIQLNADLTATDKARQIQYLMSHGTTRSQLRTESTKELADHEYSKSYHNKKEGVLGCEHYQRKVKLEANCCKKIIPCRFCHDEVEDHTIVRNETKNMMCMLCLTLQPAGQVCPNCKEEVAHYYCDKCKFWDDTPKKPIYHCDDCGICRQGKGLGEDFFHCKKCNICLSLTMKEHHKCIERNLESDCPICGEYMFNSTSTVAFMPCGHAIHRHCYTDYIQTSYQCPTCLKSLGDMSEYFNRLDKDLERQPMPAEYEKYISHIFCNDCEKKTPAKYHFFYHKCGSCGSFNTTVLKTENTEEATNPSSSTIPLNHLASVSDTSAETLGLSTNSDEEHILQHVGAAGNLTLSSSFLGAGYIRNPPPSSASSSSSRNNRNGTESNEG